jgi:hypothetical protein
MSALILAGIAVNLVLEQRGESYPIAALVIAACAAVIA